MPLSVLPVIPFGGRLSPPFLCPPGPGFLPGFNSCPVRRLLPLNRAHFPFTPAAVRTITLAVFSRRNCSRILASPPSSVNRAFRVSTGSRDCSAASCSSLVQFLVAHGDVFFLGDAVEQDQWFSPRRRRRPAVPRAGGQSPACASARCPCPGRPGRAGRAPGVRQSAPAPATRAPGTV